MTDPVQTGINAISGLAGQLSSILPAGMASTSPNNDLSLIIGNQQISGWLKVRVTRGIERLPSDFDIEITEKYPGNNTNVLVLPGAPCQLKIGKDMVLTGYVDRYMPSISASEHKVRITGRSKCQDLVDCSAEWPNGQIVNTNALDVAQKLSKPYDVNVALDSGIDAADLIKVTQMLVMYGETPHELIERVTRYSQLLYYDQPDGSLLLSRVGSKQAASGFTEGVNIQSANGTFTMDQRYSQYNVMLQALAMLSDIGLSWQVQGQYSDPNIPDTVGPPVNGISSNASAPRHRLKIIVCETSQTGEEISKARAQWEANRRWGRSFQVDVTTDSWRDSAGVLWTPNTLVPINIPSMKLVNQLYVISEVHYMRDLEKGTTARLILMPPKAFDIQPILLVPQPIQEITGPAFPQPAGNQGPDTFATPPSISPAVSPAQPMSTGNAVKLIDLYGNEQ